MKRHGGPLSAKRQRAVKYRRQYPNQYPEEGVHSEQAKMAYKRSRAAYEGTSGRRRSAARPSFKSTSRTKASLRRSNWVPSGLMGVERKFFDSTKAETNITGSTDMTSLEFDPATLNCLNAPTQGTGASNRSGDFYTIDSCEVSGKITCAQQADQTAADLAPVVKVYLVLDKYTNAAQLNSEDVFTNPSASATQSVNPFRVVKNESRFKILDSVMLQIEPPTMSYDGTNVEQSGQTHTFVLRKRWVGGLRVSCIANGGTVADIRDNSLHVIAVTNSSNSAPQIAYNARIRFRG